jgi:hypothetical protein
MFRFYNKRAARQSRSMPDYSPARGPLPRRARIYSDNTGISMLSSADATTDVQDASIRTQPSDLFNPNIDPNQEAVVSLSLADLMELNAAPRDLSPETQTIQTPDAQPSRARNETEPTYSHILEDQYVAADQVYLRSLLEAADAGDWTYECLQGVLGAQYNLGFLSARLFHIGMTTVYRRYSARFYAFGFDYYIRGLLRENYDNWREELDNEIFLPGEMDPYSLTTLGWRFEDIQSQLLNWYQGGHLNMTELRMEMRMLLQEFHLDWVNEQDFSMRMRNILATRWHERRGWFQQQFENGAITRDVLIDTLRPLYLTLFFDVDPSWQLEFSSEMDDLMSPDSQRRAHRNRLGQLGQLSQSLS